MRLIFHNPHTKIGFGQTFADFIYRSNIGKKSQKYRYILDFLIKNKIKFGIYLDYKDSSLPLFMRKNIFIKLEVIFRILIKGINIFRVNFIDDINNIKENDIFFSFLWTTLDSEYNGIDNISDKNFIKIFHFTHFHQNTSLVAKNTKKLNIDYLIAESDLQKSSYFKYFFNFYKKEAYILPFAAGKKYKNIKDFSKRQNKCLSMGAIINIFDYDIFDDFYSFFKKDTLQPIKKEIFDKQEEYSKYIDCMSQIFKVKNEAKLSPIKSFFSKCKRIMLGSKNKYFSFDIVGKLNQYKMFINGEELIGIPSIGFIEGMACGCAYIGKVDAMYTDIGLIPGIHYIGHNGTLNDIINKIIYYQKNTKELEKIAKNGYDFVKKNFNGDLVAEKFYEDLLHLNKGFISNNYNKKNIKFQCSFLQKK